jgi:hypothetical protein
MARVRLPLHCEPASARSSAAWLSAAVSVQIIAMASEHHVQKRLETQRHLAAAAAGAPELGARGAIASHQDLNGKVRRAFLGQLLFEHCGLIGARRWQTWPPRTSS